MFLKGVADVKIAEGWRVHVPAHGVAARPVAEGLRTDVERHFDADTHVVTRAAHLCQIPGRAEITRAHFGARFEAAAGDDDRLGTNVDHATLLFGLHAANRAVVGGEQRECRCFVKNFDAFARAGLVFVFNKALAATPGFSGKAAPEFVLVADLVRLAAVAGLEFHALARQPDDGFIALGDQQFAQLGVGAVLRNAAHVVEILVGGVGAVVVEFFLFGRQIGDDFGEFVDIVEDEAHQAAGVAAVAAAFLDRRRFKHDHAGAVFTRGECRAGGRVAGADDDDVRVAEFCCFVSAHTILLINQKVPSTWKNVKCVQWNPGAVGRERMPGGEVQL